MNIKTNELMPKKKSLFLVVVSLLLFGVLIIYNATSYFSQFTFGSPFRFVYLQIAWIIIGLIIFFIFSRIPYQQLKTFGFIIFAISVVFLFILSMVGLFSCRTPESSGMMFAPCINGASRWFYFNPPPLPKIPLVGSLGFQPGEVVKLSIILYLAFQLDKFEKKKQSSDAFYVYLFTSLLVTFLLILQPNMSTSLLILMITTSMYFVSGYQLKPLLIAAPILVFLASLMVLFSPYRRARFLTLLGLRDDAMQEASYHIRQITIALGSGGLFGLGFGQSRQKFQYLPEIASDSIFAIIGEEFGFVGTAIVVLVFAYLIYLGFEIAKNSPDLLGKLLATGITSWIGLQFFINVAAMTKLIPLTGVPIPLISYGGSSIVFSLAGLGILNNIYKQSI